MNRLFLILIILFLTVDLFAQQPRYNQNDTTKYYYLKTNFSKIDTLEYWKFSFEATTELNENDSINPIGIVNFWRTVSIDDSISMVVYGKLWTPHISYKIYNLKDSLYCKEISKKVRFFSSCVPPDVGGDFIILGELILLNTNVCLGCGRYDTGTDYCRPILNKVFKTIDTQKINSISSLEAQIGEIIKKE